MGFCSRMKALEIEALAYIAENADRKLWGSETPLEVDYYGRHGYLELLCVTEIHGTYLVGITAGGAEERVDEGQWGPGTACQVADYLMRFAI